MEYNSLISSPVDPTQLTSLASTYRPYYTERNALSVKGVFDTYFASPKPTLVPIQGSITIRTLYNKVTYGLKWLADRSNDRAKYQAIRASIRMKQTDRGILLSPKSTDLGCLTSNPVSSLDTNPTSWVERFIDWVTNAKTGEIFDSLTYFNGVVNVSNEDEQALIKLGAQLGLEMDINKEQGKFRAMR